tara:strand:+ start:207 stop:380 length:174 start_codon:yes stop_codon:yes gene_type:complete
LQITAKAVKYIKQNKWLIEVPIGLSIRLGCLPESPYKRYPIRLPGNKYKINKAIKEK